MTMQIVHNFLIMCTVHHYNDNHHLRVAYEEALVKLVTWKGNITPRGPVLLERVFDCGFRVETQSFLDTLYYKFVDAHDVYAFKKNNKDYKKKVEAYIDALNMDKPFIFDVHNVDLYKYVTMNYKVGI